MIKLETSAGNMRTALRRRGLVGAMVQKSCKVPFYCCLGLHFCKVLKFSLVKVRFVACLL